MSPERGQAILALRMGGIIFSRNKCDRVVSCEIELESSVKSSGALWSGPETFYD